MRSKARQCFAVNLCPDKHAAYTEAFRLLRRGGRVAISDIILTEPIPTELTERFQAAWAGCLAGALTKDVYLTAVRLAGFTDIRTVAHNPLSTTELAAMARCPGTEYSPEVADTDLSAVTGKIASLKFTASNPVFLKQVPRPGEGQI